MNHIPDEERVLLFAVLVTPFCETRPVITDPELPSVCSELSHEHRFYLGPVLFSLLPVIRHLSPQLTTDTMYLLID
jgi:hypothetical protein